MKTISLIELLIRISKNKNVPKHIKYNDEILEYFNGFKDYCTESGDYLFERIDPTILNDYVEIINEEEI